MFESVQAQIDTKAECSTRLNAPIPRLNIAKHIAFLKRGLEPLSEGYVSLDAARPWLFYWCLNGLALLPGTEQIVASYATRLRASAAACQHPDGGFGGGYGQMAHLAPTYAIISAIAVVGDENVYRVVNRQALYTWIMSLKQKDGGFAIQRDGEVDARAAYLALSVASLMNILSAEMVHGVREWLAKCQRYEGGLSGLHYAEAHGGLTFCALGALCILGEPEKILQESFEMQALLSWLVARQTSSEGGFSGRTNKLVDGCYSWWVGAAFPMVEQGLGIKESILDREALSRYLLTCSQTRGRGGMCDKPSKSPDHYHTCYCLSGLSVAQHKFEYNVDNRIDSEMGWQAFCWSNSAIHASWQEEADCIGGIHPVFAVPTGRAERLRAWSVAQGRLPNT